MKPQHKYHQVLTHFNAVISLRIRRIRVSAVLAGRFLPDIIAREAARLRADFPAGKAALFVVLTAAIVVPSLLYVEERARRTALETSYRFLDVRATAEISTLSNSLRNLAEEQEHLRSMLLETGLNVVSDGVFSTRLTATGYSSTVWQTDDTPFITASNTRTRPGVVALSRDLLERYNPTAPFRFGDTVHISGLGDFIVEDSMHWRWRKRVDIWFPSSEAAWTFGIRDVTITKQVDDETARDCATNFTGADDNPETRLAAKSVPTP